MNKRRYTETQKKIEALKNEHIQVVENLATVPHPPVLTDTLHAIYFSVTGDPPVQLGAQEGNK